MRSQRMIGLRWEAMLLLSALSLAACGTAPQQRIQPVAKLKTRDICILQNARVSAWFLTAYQSALEEIGYRVRVLPELSTLDACQITSKYNAAWNIQSLIPAPYMMFAQITVYQDAEVIGQASYLGGTGMRGTVDDQAQVKDLVKHLYPAIGRE